MSTQSKVILAVFAIALAMMCALPPWTVTVQSSSDRGGRSGVRIDAMPLGYHWLWTAPATPGRWSSFNEPGLEYSYRYVIKATTTPSIDSGVLALQLVITVIVGGLALLVPWRGGCGILRRVFAVVAKGTEGDKPYEGP